jgi:hypothetical protein
MCWPRAGSSQTSIIRVGDDFEYDVVASRAIKARQRAAKGETHHR